ncbi:hypothetical protein, conserved [Trypanosoma brucei gambiense DAL972]|uniref:Histone acetyltransferase subunit NuA4 n=2 Tax=Trypanosoma brucei TaxID=5691 RepID=C9ZXC4_TRYB9|nr:hypothetical protein, conserved [Trypanosoma brucei gambiense DAL972]RHW70205.1 histone acetyltransferase subunit NuA4 [Trypanosoma brucei equiperdum]CBH14068.1 hypothetical protein, conserved [Trypanosoma brucei gambiense DAL972]|eukprot:XP_011776339.1 hypothetical protein, conserved [Trypanosoma brucei gambiense DAL972]
MSGRGHGRGRGVAAPPGSKREVKASATLAEPQENGTATAQSQLQYLQARREAIERQLEGLDVCVYDLETTYLRHYVELGGCLFDGFGLERQQLWCTATATATATSTSSTTASSSSLGTALDARVAAYRERLHRFTPSDRIFTASSVGALGTVERVKTLEAAQEEAEATKRTRKRARGKG